MTYSNNFFKQFPIFRDLTADELKEVAQIASQKAYPRGNTIFVEGEKRTAVYFILSGLVKVFKVSSEGQEQVISFLQTEEMFPHVGFFDDTDYPATATAVTNVQLLRIPIDAFDQLLLRNPKIAIKVMKVMGEKLLELQQRIQSITSQDVFTRIIGALVKFSRELGKVQTDGKTIKINMPMTNTDLANLIGVTRESVNRALNRLKKEGIIEHSRKEILILDMERLSEYE
ncbi:Crp/Fnr family transcriptional regulator [Alkalicoccus daliensis]|uniref:CRP/FNR family transcriptional regulator, anaerobic regulatory protein n=1 Tax=Alkalicoccus daliensis TaxID=745820 RepID=A0A1H0HBJ1_9BACI|nr:Crp/Fnr family transcriptional regulator [Alkalicoccus daliensis]SDO16424.1 CRP/FNR family transcriptional regulator, anaerobic regulatory protein [Alkalicoccus daliensis]